MLRLNRSVLQMLIYLPCFRLTVEEHIWFTPVWRVCLRRMWRLRWSRFWLIPAFHTNANPGPASCQVCAITTSEIMIWWLFDLLQTYMFVLLRWYAEETLSSTCFCWRVKGCYSGRAHCWCGPIRSKRHLGPSSEVSYRYLPHSFCI